MVWTSPEAREIFQWLVKQEAERRSRDRQKVSEALQTVPACQETLDELGALSPEDAERALGTHPGYPAHRKIESVRTMPELFRRALADLDAAIAEFPELGEPNDRILRERLEKGISIRVNKELFAALGAAKTLVDYSRRLKDLVDAALFDSKLKGAFHPGEHALIMGLRNSVLHQVHSRANWQKRWRAGTKTTHFVIQRENLLAEGELSSAAREHLDRLGTTFDVTELLRGYSEKVDQFYAWLLTEVESHLPLEVSDYRACRRAVKRQHGRLSYEVMIGLWTLLEEVGSSALAVIPSFRGESGGCRSVVENIAVGTWEQSQDQESDERPVFSCDPVGVDRTKPDQELTSKCEAYEDARCPDARRDHGTAQRATRTSSNGGRTGRLHRFATWRADRIAIGGCGLREPRNPCSPFSVMMVQGAPKTEASAKDVPLDAALAESLLKLRLTGPYNRETDWVFASPTMKGKQPLWPETLWRRYGRPAVKAAKIQKRVGFHTFRHTYTTLLTQNNEEVKVVQELLRHANSRITLDLYAQAGMPNKRLAQSKLVRMVFNKGKALA